MASEAELEARRSAEAIAYSAREEGRANEQAMLLAKIDNVSTQMANLAAAVGALAERQGESEERRHIQQDLMENMRAETQRRYDAMEQQLHILKIAGSNTSPRVMTQNPQLSPGSGGPSPHRLPNPMARGGSGNGSGRSSGRNTPNSIAEEYKYEREAGGGFDDDDGGYTGPDPDRMKLEGATVAALKVDLADDKWIKQMRKIRDHLVSLGPAWKELLDQEYTEVLEVLAALPDDHFLLKCDRFIRRLLTACMDEKAEWIQLYEASEEDLADGERLSGMLTLLRLEAFRKADSPKKRTDLINRIEATEYLEAGKPENKIVLACQTAKKDHSMLPEGKKLEQNSMHRFLIGKIPGHVTHDADTTYKEMMLLKLEDHEYEKVDDIESGKCGPTPWRNDNTFFEAIARKLKDAPPARGSALPTHEGKGDKGKGKGDRGKGKGDKGKGATGAPGRQGTWSTHPARPCATSCGA
jgi:hypothetical protein